jgi:coenzyme F420-reducing hydrogenase delta subunit
MKKIVIPIIVVAVAIAISATATKAISATATQPGAEAGGIIIVEELKIDRCLYMRGASRMQIQIQIVAENVTMFVHIDKKIRAIWCDKTIIIIPED